jgi:photosystem II stability/assembly factor-like uncharacterized protein
MTSRVLGWHSNLWALQFFLLTIIVTSFRPALGQMPPAAVNDKLLEYQYFYQQRAYPYQQIPPGALRRARQQHEQQFGAIQSQIQPAFLQNTWTAIGPSQISSNPTTSGRTNTIAVDPTNTNIIYIGAATGGVWKTTNGGTTWTPLTDTQCSLAMGSIAIDPSNTLVVYAGTGEQNFSGDSYYGCGVLKSTDGGTTWTQIGAAVFAPPNQAGARISKIAVNPTSTSMLLVASDFGLYRSTDGGSTFALAVAGTATDVAIDPVSPSTAYAGLRGDGIYTSTDFGVTWTKLAGGLPTTNVDRINLAIAASSSATVYASVSNGSAASFGTLLGIWKTTNHGTNWTQLTATGATCGTQCWYDMYVAVDPTNANTVYFGGLSIWKSTDGGSTFSNIGSAIHTDQHALTFQPGNATTIYAGNDGGVFMSTNGGSTWTSLNTNLAITQFYPGLSIPPNSISTATGGTQDNSTLLYSGPSTIWAPLAFVGVGGCDGGFTAIDFATPTTGYAECQWVSNSGPPPYSGPRLSTNIGVNAYNLVTNGINLADPGQFIAPLVMSPSNSHTLYFGTNKIYKTTNQGTNWIASGTTLFGNVTFMAEAPSNANVVYAGSSFGVVYKSTDGNATYTAINTGLPNRVPTYLVVHPTDANTAFVTFSGFGTGHVFKTTNGGTSWSDISGNLPDIPTNTILIDPSAPTLEIMVGTDLGVYQSHDGGMTWSPFNNGLPNVPVLDLKLNAGVVFAATHGRSVWKATTAFSAFTAQLVVYPNRQEFNINCYFTLGASSNGINPPTELVTLQIGSFETTIQPGSFVKPGAAPEYFFVGVIDGVSLSVSLIKLGSSNNYAFGVIAKNVSLPVSNPPVPIPVTLTIGADSGTTTVTPVVINTQ